MLSAKGSVLIFLYEKDQITVQIAVDEGNYSRLIRNRPNGCTRWIWPYTMS